VRSLRMAPASTNHATTRITLLIATARSGSPICIVTKISPALEMSPALTKKVSVAYFARYLARREVGSHSILRTVLFKE
jgi:hypothetical protein